MAQDTGSIAKVLRKYLTRKSPTTKVPNEKVAKFLQGQVDFAETENCGNRKRKPKNFLCTAYRKDNDSKYANDKNCLPDRDNIVSEPDPRKRKEGLGDRLGRKCTLRPDCRRASDWFMIVCQRVY